MARGGARAHRAREGARSSSRGGEPIAAPVGALLAVLILSLAAGLCFAGPAAAKSYTIDDVRIDAASQAERRPAGHRAAHVLVRRQLPLRLLGPQRQGRQGHRGPRRERAGRAAEADRPEGRVGLPGHSWTRLHTCGGALSDGLERHVHPALPRARRGQAVRRHRGAVLAVRRRRLGGADRQGGRRRDAAGGREAGPRCAPGATVR